MLGIKTTVIVVMLFAALLALLLGYQYITQKLGINTQPSQPQQPMINKDVYYEYRCICETLIDCVRGNYRHFGLDTPGDLVDHLLAPQDGIRTKDGQLFFVYQFRRGQDAINIVQHRTSYNTTPAAEITRLINAEIERYCIADGVPVVKIYKAFDGTDGAIRFAVSV